MFGLTCSIVDCNISSRAICFGVYAFDQLLDAYPSLISAIFTHSLLNLFLCLFGLQAPCSSIISFFLCFFFLLPLYNSLLLFTLRLQKRHQRSIRS